LQQTQQSSVLNSYLSPNDIPDDEEWEQCQHQQRKLPSSVEGYDQRYDNGANILRVHSDIFTNGGLDNGCIRRQLGGERPYKRQ